MWLFDEEDNAMEEYPQDDSIQTQGDSPKPESFTKRNGDQQQPEGTNDAGIELFGPPLSDDIREKTPDSSRHQDREKCSPDKKHFRKFSKSYVVEGTAAMLFRCSSRETVRYIVIWLA